MWERWEMHSEMFSKNLKGRGHLEDLAVDGNNIKIDLKKWSMNVDLIRPFSKRDPMT
jgi:hypothetical protein